MLQVYREVHPEPDNPSGSILMFGAVAKERHEEEAEHHHCAAYSCRRHRWGKVAKVSYEKYKVA